MQNGVKPSILSYSAAPYGNAVYQWASNLSLSLDPICATLSLFVLAHRRWLLVLSVVFSLLVVYLLAIALQSPSPPLRHSGGGEELVVLAAALSAALIAYVKVGVCRTLRRCKDRRCTPSVTFSVHFIIYISIFLCIFLSFVHPSYFRAPFLLSFPPSLHLSRKIILHLPLSLFIFTLPSPLSLISLFLPYPLGGKNKNTTPSYAQSLSYSRPRRS